MIEMISTQNIIPESILTQGLSITRRGGAAQQAAERRRQARRVSILCARPISPACSLHMTGSAAVLPPRRRYMYYIVVRVPVAVHSVYMYR